MSFDHEGDMAEAVSRRLHSEHLEAIAAAGDTFADEEPVMVANVKALFDRITFRWRADERSQLDRIRAAADTIVKDMFVDAYGAMDDFFAEVRVPEVNEHGVVLHDQDGRIVWRCDDRGDPIEDWSCMTGQDIEACLFRLSRIKLSVASQVHELLMEAVFAKHVHDDQYQEAYAEMLDETIPGRNAYASRKTRQDKYHAFFRYYLWSTSKVFLDEVTNFCRLLERVRYWRIDDMKIQAKRN